MYEFYIHAWKEMVYFSRRDGKMRYRIMSQCLHKVYHEKDYQVKC